jgi:hypothetical protein
MRTTLRDKAILWINGMGIAAAIELVLSGSVDPLSTGGLGMLGILAAGLTVMTTFLLRIEH